MLSFSSSTCTKNDMKFTMMMKMMGASTNRFINEDSILRQWVIVYYMNIFLLYLCALFAAIRGIYNTT